jgi:hypothetical protein
MSGFMAMARRGRSRKHRLGAAARCRPSQGLDARAGARPSPPMPPPSATDPRTRATMPEP